MIKIGFIGKKEMFEQLLNCPNANKASLHFINLAEVYNKRLDLNYIIVRNTSNKLEYLRKFILLNPHIDFIDNITRFFDSQDKRISSKIRELDGTGAKNYNSLDNIEYPIFIKPFNGKKNKGIQIFEEEIKFKEFSKTCDIFSEYIVQEKLNLIDEFRVLYLNINNKIKYFITRKKKCACKKNQFIRYKVSESKKNKLINFLEKNRWYKKGIIGYDIGITSSGELKIIEENRAPEFNRSQRLRNVNILDEILKLILE